MKAIHPNSERANWRNITPEDATESELHLVHMIMGPRPEWLSREQWRDNMRSCAKHIRDHVDVVGFDKWEASLQPGERGAADYEAQRKEDLREDINQRMRDVLEHDTKHLLRFVHGVNCRKEEHDPQRGGYLHTENDDTSYIVDGVRYCGRCHEWMGAGL